MASRIGSPPGTAVSQALKEWDVVVAALEQGRQAILIRKGGLHDPGRRLPIPRGRFWLYPTLFHERGVFLRQEHRSLLVPGAHRLRRAEATMQPRPDGHARPVTPGHVSLGSLGEVVDCVVAPGMPSLTALLPRTVWTEKYPTLRYRWRPEERPLVLVLRVLTLPGRVEVPELAEYGGCRSLVSLVTPPASDAARPVWTEARLDEEVEAVRSLLRA